MINPGTTAEQLLDTLGITDPKDLDIEAIAFYCGATVLYERLTGCEANIVGAGDRAIITVNSDSLPGRQRFSAGHELGHWMRDRGQSAFGCTLNQITVEWSSSNPETRANTFASDLLLPKRLFVPLAENKPINLETLFALAKTFRTSLTATAIKLVELGSYPAMAVYYENGTRKWFKRPRSVPQSLWPPSRLDPGSLTSRLLARDQSQAEDDIRSDRWFEHRDADKHYIRESCFRTGPESAVAVIWWEEETQIIEMEEEEERNAARRSDEYFRRR